MRLTEDGYQGCSAANVTCSDRFETFRGCGRTSCMLRRHVTCITAVSDMRDKSLASYHSDKANEACYHALLTGGRLLGTSGV